MAVQLGIQILKGLKKLPWKSFGKRVLLETGTAVAGEVAHKVISRKDSMAKKLKRIEKMKRKGLITEVQFEELRSKIIADSNVDSI